MCARSEMAVVLHGMSLVMTKEGCKDTAWWVFKKQTCCIKLQLLFLSQMQLEHSESAQMQRITVLYENDQSISYCTVFFYMEIAV